MNEGIHLDLDTWIMSCISYINILFTVCIKYITYLYDMFLMLSRRSNGTQLGAGDAVLPAHAALTLPAAGHTGKAGRPQG